VEKKKGAKSHHELLQLLADFDEAEVKFSAEVIRQPPVVVVDAEVGRAHLADAQLLLLVRTGIGFYELVSAAILG
jgi:hypothetical protein